jgi:integrase
MAARDSRNRRIPGLATRNGRFYGVLWADRGDGRKGVRRFPLLGEDGEAVRTLTDAKEALDVLRSDRRGNQLPKMGRKPGFDVFVAEYLEMASTQQKRKATQNKESDALGRWKVHLANVRIDRITTAMIKGFMEMRLRGCRLSGKAYEPASARTVSLDFIALRNALKAAVDAGHLRELPRFPKLKMSEPARRSLLSGSEFETLLACCLSRKKNGEPLTKNGEQLRDFLRLLAFTGAREQEGLRLRWAHVDFDGRRLFIGADENFTAAAMTVGTGGTSKNRGSRVVDFNAQLECHLREMHARRAPDSSWLFPSPQRGGKDIPAKTLRESFELVRIAANLPGVGFHDLRHQFCSYCVMHGIDFLTIAGWLGHKDGGILIGKVYGHLLDEHRQKMANKLTIGFAVVSEPADADRLAG